MQAPDRNTPQPSTLENTPLKPAASIPHDAEAQTIGALKESEERFRAAMAAVQGILWTNNAKGQMKGEQPGWAALTGQTYEQYQDYGWAAAVHPDDAQPTITAWNKAVQQQKPFIFEHRLLLKDGSWGRFSIQAIPVLNADGTIREWVGVHTDITEQRQAEERLRESEERFRTFSNNITNLAWIADGDGWIYWYNQRWYDYTGTTLEQMQGWGWEKVHHPYHITRIVDFVKEAWGRDEPFELTFPLRRHDGEYRWFLTRAVPVKNAAGKIYRWIGTNTDIHDQKLAEDRFRTLAESLPQLVWMMNEKGEQDYASSKWKEYSGIEPAGWQTWKEMVHPDDLPIITKEWTESLASGRLYRSEARLKNKFGAYRWHFVQGEPVRDEAGKIIKWIGAFTDIHDQKTLSEKLEKLVAERTRDLQRSNDDLEQFAHVASHDLKEPVRKIRTFTDRIMQEFAQVLPERASLYLKKIEDAAARMYQMIDGVLDYAGINATEQAIMAVNLTEILRQTESDLELVIHQKEAVIIYENLPVIEGAPVLLNQLFYNLINNALKFSKADVPPQIRISATAIPGSEAAQEWELNQSVDYVQILIQDNGIGFAQEQAERIFKTFTRLNARDKYEGTGLGLALCKKIVERHHGAISAIGMPGMGTIFKLLLPLQQPHSNQ